MESHIHGLALPSSKSAAPGSEPTSSVQSEGPVVIVGANGSGKTRLGTWIELESYQRDSVRRIAAQKSLAMSASATSVAVDQARMELLYGASDFDVNNPDLRLVYRRDLRWHRKPATFLLNDFDALLTYLFSEANETNAKYVEEIRHDKERRIELEPPETKLAATKRVWEGVLPHRKLEIGGQGGDAGLWRAWIERLLVQRLGDERRRARDFT